MEPPASLSRVLVWKRVVAYLAGFAIGGAAVGYAVHEQRKAESLAAQNEHVNEQVTAALDATRNQLDDLAAKVNTLALRSETQPAPSPPSPPVRVATSRRVVPSPPTQTDDPRFNNLQSQLDAQGKEIEQNRTDLASTRGELATASTELTSSVARTHEELVLLEKKGERNYYEFDIHKSKEFQHEGPVGISLRKANTKRQYADLQLLVEDQDLTQKHVNLYQPVMFYRPDSRQPVEVVINNISKDQVHGYVSSPKYRQSQLASMPSASAKPASSQGQGAANPSAQPSSRDQLTPPR